MQTLYVRQVLASDSGGKDSLSYSKYHPGGQCNVCMFCGKWNPRWRGEEVWRFVPIRQQAWSGIFSAEF